MNIQDYSTKALSTMHNDHQIADISPQLISQVYGLVEEGGEVAGKFKKLIRDKGGVLDEESKAEIIKELGDVLWYVNSIASLLDSSLEEVAEKNIAKLASRKERGVLAGSGDNR